MPLLFDLLKQSSTTPQKSQISGALIKFANLLHTDVNTARSLYEKHGKGYIYTPTGLVFADRDINRVRVSKMYTFSVIVCDNGDIVYISRYKARKERIKARQLDEEIAARREKSSERRERARIRVKRVTEGIFSDGQTRPQPKRGGRGNSIGDVGKYVNKRRAFTVDEYAQALENLSKQGNFELRSAI